MGRVLPHQFRFHQPPLQPLCKHFIQRIHPKQPVNLVPQNAYMTCCSQHLSRRESRVSEHLDICDKVVDRIKQVDAEVCRIRGEVGGGRKGLLDLEAKFPVERVRLVWTRYVRVHRAGLR